MYVKEQIYIYIYLACATPDLLVISCLYNIFSPRHVSVWSQHCATSMPSQHHYIINHVVCHSNKLKILVPQNNSQLLSQLAIWQVVSGGNNIYNGSMWVYIFATHNSLHRWVMTKVVNYSVALTFLLKFE